MVCTHAVWQVRSAKLPDSNCMTSATASSQATTADDKESSFILKSLRRVVFDYKIPSLTLAQLPFRRECRLSYLFRFASLSFFCLVD